MDVGAILSLVKQRLGIMSDVRDEYLTARIKAVLDELEREKGVKLDPSDYNHILFVVDYTTWKYQSVESGAAMPRFIQFALHNLMIHSGGGSGAP